MAIWQDLKGVTGLGGSVGFLKVSAAGAFSVDTGTYQASNAKLTAIAALASSAGYLKNDGAGNFSYATPAAVMTRWRLHRGL